MSKEIGRRGFLAGVGAAGLLTATGLPARAGNRTTGSRTAVRTLIVNGNVFTGTNGPAPASAVAIGVDGCIVGVGSNAEMRRLVGSSTEVIDAAGGTVMAGIHDGHMHPLPAAEQSLNPSLDNAELTVPELQAALQAMLDATSDKEPGGWLQVTNWNPVGLLRPGRSPTSRS